MGKGLLAAAVVGGVSAIVVKQLPEIRRYMKIESM
jgi:hypothetical protein